MPKAVDKAIRKVAKNVKPRKGQTKEGAAIAILKSKGIIKQKGKHLTGTNKLKK